MTTVGNRVTVVLTRWQAELLDRSAGGAGDRGRVLVGALREHPRSDGVADRRRERRDPPPPQPPGQLAMQMTLEPGTGKALELRRGDVLRVEQIDGGQCVDFNCFNLADPREHLHAAGTRTRHGVHPSGGDLLWSRPPYERPMMGILADTAGVIDTLFPRCTAGLYEDVLGLAGHGNCQDIQAEAQREYGLGAELVHDSVNLFMATAVERDGRPVILPNPSRPGDHVELVAFFDLLAVFNICADDVWPTSNFDQRPVRISVSTGGDEALARFGDASEAAPRAGGRRTGADANPLRRDPGYVPRFEAPPERVRITVELDDRDRERVATLIEDGVGRDAAEVLRACYLLTCVREIEARA